MRKSVIESAIRHAARSDLSPCQQVPLRRAYHQTSLRRATALPITATGPPPSPPQPSASEYGERVAKKRRQAEMLKQGKDLRAAYKQGDKTSPLRKRFWKEVNVTEVAEGYQVYLDTRPIRTPAKTVLTVPKTKAHLAHAIAIEWDLLTSAQQALKNHNIPMTSIVSRAQDMLEADSKGDPKVRNELLKVMMRYFETDTLLCWSPSKNASVLDMHAAGEEGPDLRQTQIKAAEQIISYLKTTIWPGVEIKPVLDEDSIMPNKQSEVTTSIIAGWISGLPAYELAALERAVLASKSLLVGTRLLIEWSEEFRDLQRPNETRFGIEEAAMASTIEVRFQTGVWGEVEDTHDVENEDLRRQLGSAILVMSGSR